MKTLIVKLFHPHISSGAAEFVDCGGILTVIDIAKRFKSNVELFTASLAVLENVSIEPEYSMQIAHENATGLVMSALKAFQETSATPTGRFGREAHHVLYMCFVYDGSDIQS